ncbi:MAG: TlpA disulfide reductase family protein [Bacteroidota bacterium]
MMKWISTTVVLLFICSILSAQKQIPDVLVKNLKGQEVNILNELKNADYTVLSFWATWCSPCKKELNIISEYYEDWQKDYNMQLIAVSIDDARAAAKVPSIVNSNWWDYVVLIDSNSAFRTALNVAAIPRTMIVDKTGKIHYDHSGYKPGDEEELEGKLKVLNQ